jgi:hypothetical protein
MNITRFTICLTVVILAAGCMLTTPSHPLRASQGWNRVYYQLNPAITADYQNYIQRLPQKDRRQLTESSIHFFENTNGQHAVLFEIGRKGVWGTVVWAHVLVYGADNKRMKTMHYKSRESMS